MGALIRSWGFNTAGGFSAPNLPFPSIPELDLGWRANILWSDFFDPSVRQRTIMMAQNAVAFWKGNPYRIGYFSDNEIGWWNGALFLYYMRKPGANHAKQKLVALIRAHYHDSWRCFVNDFVVPLEISSFNDLLHSTGVTARLRPGGKGIEVVRAWTEMVATNYYSLVYQALRKADPQALIFGDRLPGYYDPDAVRAEAPYVDAIATNYNVDSPDGWIAHYYFDGLRELTGNKPILISEWYYLAQENRSGNSNNKRLMTVRTQAERARGAANAARRFALIPAVVGIHWFQYFDEPRGGRSDGEDCNFGLVDTSSRPYVKLVEALATANRSLAKIHQGQMRSASRPRDIAIPEASIDVRKDSLAAWPKDQAFVQGLAAPLPEVPFGDMFLAWSSAGLHFATISMDYYDPHLLAYEGPFPLSDAFRIDVGVDAGNGPRRVTLFVIPPRVFPKKGPPAMRMVCHMNNRPCDVVPPAITTHVEHDQPRIIAQATVPWSTLGVSGPPRDGRLRVQLAATAFFRSRWMSLSGSPPYEAMKDEASWNHAKLEGR